MLKLGNTFEETFELYGENKIPLNIFTNIASTIFMVENPEFNDILNLLITSTAKEDYNKCGGHFFLIENIEDLKEIKTNLISGNVWNTLYDTADAFDICQLLPLQPPTVVVCNMTNDSGGNTYYIPNSFITANVLNSIILTNKFWDNVEKNNVDNS